MSCEQHKKEVAGISDMKVLAEMIGDLHYEALVELLENLTDKFIIDAAKDRAAGRTLLARNLEYLSNEIQHASIEAANVWRVSKPFMK